MSGPEFWNTILGRKFIEGTCMRVAESLAEIAKELKRQNDLKEVELKKKEDNGCHCKDASSATPI